MKRQAFTIWEIVICFLIIGILATIFYPLSVPSLHRDEEKPVFQSNLTPTSLKSERQTRKITEKNLRPLPTCAPLKN